MKLIANLISKINNSEKLRLLACAVSGVLSSIPFFIEELFIIEWFSFIPFFAVIFLQKKLTSRKAFLYGFVHQFTRSIVVLSWFKELYSMGVLNFSPTFMTAVIIAADIGLSALQSIPFGLCAIAVAAISKYGRSIPANTISVATLYTMTELFHTIAEQIGLIGFPWVLTYISQSSFTPAIQISSVFGAHFVTFIIIAFSVLVTYAILHFQTDGKKSRVFALSAILIIVTDTIFGAALLAFDSAESNGKAITAAVYQDNNSSYDKWSGSSVEVCDTFIADMETHFETHDIPDIIVMSETVFTVTLDPQNRQSGSSGRYIAEQLRNFTKKHNNTVICGGFYNDGKNVYNAQFVFDKGQMSDTVYKKRTLVPFGEYMPAQETIYKLIPALADFNLSGNSLTPGNSSEIYHTSNGYIGGMICYDSIFWYNASESTTDGAELLVLSTNDSWYNDSAAAYQHFSQSVFRAVENRRYIVRCATTGVSGIIDAYGRTKTSSDLLVKEIIQSNVRTNNNTTVFSHCGYTYLYVLCVASIAYTVYNICKNKKEV